MHQIVSKLILTFRREFDPFVDTHITTTKHDNDVTEDEPVTTATNTIEIRCTMQPNTNNLEKPCSITLNDLSKTLPREVT